MNLNPENNNDELYEAEANSQLRSAQTLITVAVIAGPVSLILGGVLLSIVALICAVVAKSKINRARSFKGDGGIVRSLTNQATVALVVSSIATVLNIAAFIVALVFIVDAINSGTFDELINSLYSGQIPSSLDSGSGTNSSSVWD